MGSSRAVSRRPKSFWRYLSRAVSARASFQFLPGTRFVSRRIDLTANWGFNKGVCIWFEHMWPLLFDPRFFPDAATRAAKDLRAFTRLADASLPLGLRTGPDGVMLRHYLLTADEQCAIIRDAAGCHYARVAAMAGRAGSRTLMTECERERGA